MKTVPNTRPAFDSVFVGEAQIDTMSTPSNITLVAKFGYANSQNGDRHGFSHRSVWSPDTLQKLRELVDAMESDIAAAVFGEGARGSGFDPSITTSGGVPSL